MDRDFLRRKKAIPKNNAIPEDGPDYESLRKELTEVTNSKAEMELEYMNLLSSLEYEKRTMEGLLSSRTGERDRLQNAVDNFEIEVKELRNRIDLETQEHKAEVCRLQASVDFNPQQGEGPAGKSDQLPTPVEKEMLMQKEETSKNCVPLDDDKEFSVKKTEEALRAAETKLEAALQENKSLRLIEQKNVELQQKLTELHAINTENESEYKFEEEKRNEAIDERDTLLESANKKITEQNKTFMEISEKNHFLMKEVSNLSEQLEEVSRQHNEDVSTLKTLQEDAEKEALSRIDSANQLQEVVSQLESEILGKEKELDALKRTRSTLDTQNDKLEKELDGLKKLFDDESQKFKKEMEALEEQYEIEKKKAIKAVDVSAGLQSTVSDLQSRIVVKDEAIESLKCTVSNSIEQNESLKGEVILLRQQLENESYRADSLEMEIDARKLAHGFTRRNSPLSIGSAEERSGDDRADIHRLRKTIAEKDAIINEKEKEIQIMQLSLQKKGEKSDESSSLEEEGNETTQEHLVKTNLIMLQKDFAAIKAQNAILEKELVGRVSMESNLEKRLENEQGKRNELKKELGAKEEEFFRMRRAFDELCASMKSLASARREETDELQAEITRYAEIVADREEEIHKMARLVDEMKQRSVLTKVDMNQQKPVVTHHKFESLKRTNAVLKNKIAALTAQTKDLQSSLDLAQAGDSSHSVKALQSRNEALKKENEMLRKSYDGLERSITRVSI